jgi:hypothetical protein
MMSLGGKAFCATKGNERGRELFTVSVKGHARRHERRLTGRENKETEHRGVE